MQKSLCIFEVYFVSSYRKISKNTTLERLEDDIDIKLEHALSPIRANLWVTRMTRRRMARFVYTLSYRFCPRMARAVSSPSSSIILIEFNAFEQHSQSASERRPCLNLHRVIEISFDRSEKRYQLSRFSWHCIHVTDLNDILYSNFATCHNGLRQISEMEADKYSQCSSF